MGSKGLRPLAGAGPRPADHPPVLDRHRVIILIGLHRQMGEQ